MARKMKFKAELQQVMEIIVHSLYSHKEIFLRELISNASDAIDNLRYQSLTRPELAGKEETWEIRLIPDQKARTLTVRDNGIGMTREEIIENLGTLAKSGTREFIKQIQAADKKDFPELIGQFGVGFYSAFIVAENVTVISRAAGEESSAVRWSSSGQGEYTVEEADKKERGTEVILTLREEEKEFLDEWRIKEVVKKFSDFLEHPVILVTKDGEDEEKTKEETLNHRKAIWLRPQSEVSEQEYAEFYKHISRDIADPAKIIHFVAEGRLEFRAILFIPAKKPFDMLWHPVASGLQLYVRRVFITAEFEKLMPAYLRFVKGVVDSTDLPLNVSREMLQENELIEKIRKSLVNKVLNTLEQMKKEEPDKYLDFYREFGSILKEGVNTDWANREKLTELLLFQSTRTPAGKYTALEEYLKRMPEGQEEIYYLVGESRAELEGAPYLESLAARGREVLFFTDPLDEWLAGSLGQYKDKRFKPVDRGELAGESEDSEALKDKEKQFRDFLEFLNGKIEEVKQVRLSTRLKESAACLVAEEDAPSAHMERLMKRLGHEGDFPETGRILELNPEHPAVAALRELHAKNPADERIEKYGRLLYEQAVIAEGSKLKDAAGFTGRINELIRKNLVLGE